MSVRKYLSASQRLISNFIDNPAVILLYHRVTDLTLDPQQLSVSPVNFNDQIVFLKTRYVLLTIDEFKDIILHKRKIPKNSVIITFDDGYADNFHEAMPILERANAQAIFYITTSNLGTAYELWWDELERIFLSEGDLPQTLVLHENDAIRSFKTSSSKERKQTYDALHPLVKNSTNEVRKQLLNEIISWSGLSPQGRETHRMLTPSELISFSKSPSVVIGAHTLTHPKLSVCDRAVQQEEITQSKIYLEKLLKKSITHFSYPFGGESDYNQSSLQICEGLGFDFVCANVYGQVHRWSNRFALPRILVRDWPVEIFKDKMNRFFRF
jgi:peptidoglycan/xylan/chitin deacetylase (PgdA/CDA1 family)